MEKNFLKHYYKNVKLISVIFKFVSTDSRYLFESS